MVLATVLVLVGFGAILVALTMVVLIREVIGDAKVNDPAAFTPWIIGILEGLMLVAAWGFTVRKYRVGWQVLGLRRPSIPRSFASLRLPMPLISLALMPFIALLGSLVITALYTIIVSALGLELLEPPSVTDELLGGGATRILNFAMIDLWGPFAEEVFFRGFLLAGLVASLGTMRGVVAASIIFAVAHFSLGSMIPIFVTGMLLSWLYLRTRSLWPPLVAHAAQNLIALALVPLAQ
jgi:membrane protease YdiL (CAAX protease family)